MHIKHGIGLGFAIMLALPFANTVSAQESISVTEGLMRASGLSLRQVRMAVGAGVADSRYRPSAERVERVLLHSVGETIYKHARHYGELTPQDIGELTTIIENRSGQRVAINLTE